MIFDFLISHLFKNSSIVYTTLLSKNPLNLFLNFSIVGICLILSGIALDNLNPLYKKTLLKKCGRGERGALGT